MNNTTFRQVQSLLDKAEHQAVLSIRHRHREVLRICNERLKDDPPVKELEAARDFLERGTAILKKSGCVIADDLQDNIKQINLEIDRLKGFSSGFGSGFE